MNLYFSRGGFPCCICSTQIHFLCFPGKLESAVIPHRRAHLSLFTWQSLRWDNIWHILPVGTELFWSLKKKKVRRHFQGGTHKFNQSTKQKMHQFVTGAKKLVWFVYLPKQVYVELFVRVIPWNLHPPVKASSGSWKERDGCQVGGSSKALHFPSHSQKIKLFSIQDKVYGFTARVCGRTQYINSACSIRVKQ